MRPTDKPDHLPALGAPIRREDAHDVRVATDAAYAAGHEFEHGDHQVDGTVLRKGHAVALDGLKIHEADGWPPRTIVMDGYTYELRNDAMHIERAAPPAFPFFVPPKLVKADELHALLDEMAERLPAPGSPAIAQNPGRMHRAHRERVERQSLYASLTDEQILNMTDEEDAELQRQHTQRFARPPIDMEPADDTLQEVLDNLRDNASELDSAMFGRLAALISTAISDAVPVARHHAHYASRNVLLRLFQRSEFTDTVAEAVDAYYPCTHGRRRLIDNPTDEVSHGQARHERDSQPAQAPGTAGGGGVGYGRFAGDQLVAGRHDGPSQVLGLSINGGRNGANATAPTAQADGCLQWPGGEGSGQVGDGLNGLRDGIF